MNNLDLLLLTGYFVILAPFVAVFGPKKAPSVGGACPMSSPKIIHIIGYGPGVGHEVALAFGREGFQAAVFSRSPGRHQAALEGLNAQGIRAKAWAMDAGQQTSIAEGMQAAAKQLGAPSVLVYNAVAFRMQMPTEIAADDLVDDFKANVAGGLVAAQQFLRLSEGQERRTILFTGGGWALYPDAAVASTAIGKAGLRHLALMMHDELKAKGVRVGVISIMGGVERGGPFDPAKIAQAYVDLYRAPEAAFSAEVAFTGA